MVQVLDLCSVQCIQMVTPSEQRYILALCKFLLILTINVKDTKLELLALVRIIKMFISVTNSQNSQPPPHPTLQITQKKKKITL